MYVILPAACGSILRSGDADARFFFSFSRALFAGEVSLWRAGEQLTVMRP